MKEIFSSSKLPAAVGPYNQAIEYGGFFFTSALLPLDPVTSDLVEGDLAVQTRRSMDNLKIMLEEAGLSMADLVTCKLYITDMSKFSVVNEVYGTYFEGIVAPARICVEVSALAKGADIEIEAVAGRGAGK